MVRLAEFLAFFAPDIEVLSFPAWDCLPYDRVSPNPAVISERIATLSRLLDPAQGPRIVLTTVNAAVQRIPPRLVFLGESLDVKSGGVVKPEKLIAYLESHGYGRADTVMEPGEYAVRGGILDIFPQRRRRPCPPRFFRRHGGERAPLRPGDPAQHREGRGIFAAARLRGDLGCSQRRTVPHRMAGIIRSGPPPHDPIYQAISEGRRYPGMEHWVPLFHESMETLVDYLETRPFPSTTRSRMR